MSLTPRTAAFVLALLLAGAIAVDLLWMPVQVFDALDEMLDVQRSPSVWSSFINSFHFESAYLRPLRIAQIKALFDLAGGEHYWLVYRGFHVLLVIAAFVLFTSALRVSTTIDFAASAFALAVLIGLHTFWPTVQEAFPVNHFLEVVVLCLLVLNLAQSRGGWWADAGAGMAFVAATLTLESGVLVWVVALTARAVGWRGISTRGLAAMTALAAGYVYLRFIYLSDGLPDLSLRSSGFGFATLDPEELQQRFGDQPAWFYAYNVAASALSVLFSEPRAGVFAATRAWLSGDLLPRLSVPVATSVGTTAILVWTAVRSLRRPRTFDDTARFVALFAVVLAANALVSYAYTKNDIMSIAGTFYAMAAFAAVRAALQPLDRLPRRAAIAVMIVVSMLTAGWSVRAAGLHHILRTQAFRHQNDWVQLPGDWQRRGRWPADAAGQRLIHGLRDSAVSFELPNTRIGVPRWTDRVWED